MILTFAPNPFKRLWAIFILNKQSMIAIAILSAGIVALYELAGWERLQLPAIPVSILGGGLAIFLAFRNNSAYDRWWEARKVWGGIVNSSRSFALSVLSLPQSNDQEALRAWQKQTIYRQLAWANALRLQLRKQTSWDQLQPFLSEAELAGLDDARNKATMLMHAQGQSFAYARTQGWIDGVQQVEFNQLMREFTDYQGMCERIKSTVFPYYYSYFTRIFLWLFILALPLATVKDLQWGTIPVSIAVSLVFTILEGAGKITEHPFQGLAADTPMTTICRTIEIDLRQMLGEKEIPNPLTAQPSALGAYYLD